MTITSVELTQEGTSLSGQGRKDGFINRNYNAHYRVITTDPTTAALAIEAYFKRTTALPWYGRVWRWSSSAGNAIDATSICKKIEISHVPSSAGIFKVEALFEPVDEEDQKEKPDNEDGDKDPDPLKWREQVSVSYTQVTEPVMSAIFHGFSRGSRFERQQNEVRGTNALQRGKWYIPQNSALVPYDPLPEMEIDILVMRFVKNVPSWNTNIYQAWISTVNKDLVNINKPQLKFFAQIDPLMGRIKQIGAQSDFQNGVTFFRREIEIWVHPNGWRGRLADMGFAGRPKDATDDGFVSPGDLEHNPGRVEQVLLKDGAGYPMTSPISLDGFGRPLRTDKPDEQVWTNWQYYNEREWQPIAAQF